jgi:hypothetical protein
LTPGDPKLNVDVYAEIECNRSDQKTLKMVSRTSNTITTLILGDKGACLSMRRPIEMSVYLSNTGTTNKRNYVFEWPKLSLLKTSNKRANNDNNNKSTVLKMTNMTTI